MTPPTPPRRCWHLLGQSVRGASHRRSGLPNQDALGLRLLPEGVAAAVADGHGDPRSFRSDRGAAFAVQAALEVLEDVAARSAALGFSQFKRSVEEGLARDVVWRWRHLVAADLEAHPVSPEEGPPERFRREDPPEFSYGTTVLGALGTGSYLLCFQLGDGDLLTVRDGRVATPLPPDPRCFANVTTSLCLPDAGLDVRTALLPRHEDWPSLVLLATDGYGNAFAGREAFLRVGSDLEQILNDHPGAPGREALERELPSWLEEASVQGSGDDVTVALLIRDEAPGHGTRPTAS